MSMPDEIFTIVETAKALRCTRAPDRRKMVKAVERVAALLGGLTVESRPSPLQAKTAITVHIRQADGPAWVMIWLDGDSDLHRRGRDTYLGHWNIESKSDVKFCPSFAFVIGGTVNEFHGHKATQAAEGFGYFLLRIAMAFEALREGIRGHDGETMHPALIAA